MARLGAGGRVAGLVAAVGRDRARSALPAAQGETCRLEIVANVRLGPSVGALLQGNVRGELRGELSFALGADGAIDRGRWRLEDDTELPVVGQAAGRAINLRVRAGARQTLVLVGTAGEGLSKSPLVRRGRISSRIRRLVPGKCRELMATYLDCCLGRP